MMEEVGSDDHVGEVTTQMAQTEIASQLQDAACTDVTQASISKREDTPPKAVTPSSTPTSIPQPVSTILGSPSPVTTGLSTNLPTSLPTSLPSSSLGPSPSMPGMTVAGSASFTMSPVSNLSGPSTSGGAQAVGSVTPPRGFTPPRGVTPPRGMTPPYMAGTTPGGAPSPSMAPPPVGGFVPTAGVVQVTHKPMANPEVTALSGGPTMPPASDLGVSASTSQPLVGSGDALPQYMSPTNTPSTQQQQQYVSPIVPQTQQYTSPPAMQMPVESPSAVSVPLDASSQQYGPYVIDHDDSTQQSSGLFGWFASSNFMNKMVEKTKSGVESMITTLDPGMKDVIKSGGDISVVVTSVKEVKVAGIRQAFQEVFGKATVTGMDSQPNIAPQPVGYSAGLKGAEDRIDNLRRTGAVHERQPIVSVENFIAELIPDRWYDLGCIVLKDPGNNVELQVFTQAVPVPTEYVLSAQDQTPSDYNLRWSGLSVTIGHVIHQQLPYVHHADWHSHLAGVSRKDMIYNAAKTLAFMYKQRLPPQYT